MDLTSLISSAIAALALLISIFNSRSRASRAQMQEVVKSAQHEFREALEGKLDRKFEELATRFIDKGTMDLRFKLIDNELAHSQEVFGKTIHQHDHRITRNQEQIGMLMDKILQMGAHRLGRPTKEQMDR